MFDIDGRFLRSSRPDRRRVNGIRVIHHEKHAPRGCTDSAWHKAIRTLAYGGDPEGSVADRQLSDDLFAVAHNVEHARSEGLLIERDRRRPLVDPELGLYGRHDVGVCTLNQTALAAGSDGRRAQPAA